MPSHVVCHSGNVCRLYDLKWFSLCFLGISGHFLTFSKSVQNHQKVKANSFAFCQFFVILQPCHTPALSSSSPVILQSVILQPKVRLKPLIFARFSSYFFIIIEMVRHEHLTGFKLMFDYLHADWFSLTETFNLKFNQLSQARLSFFDIQHARFNQENFTYQ